MSRIVKKESLAVSLSNEEKNVAIDKLHRMIRDGTLGEDYTIANRDKNRQLRRDYYINDDKIKEVLLGVQLTNLIKVEKSNNGEHPDDIVFVFKKTILLMPRWQENADYQNVNLYIKITWPVKSDGAVMFIISFHEDDI